MSVVRILSLSYSVNIISHCDFDTELEARGRGPAAGGGASRQESSHQQQSNRGGEIGEKYFSLVLRFQLLSAIFQADYACHLPS